MFLSAPETSPAAASLYASDVDQRGFVMNLSRAWAWRPEVCEAFSALRSLLTSSSSLTQRELAVMVCAAAAGLGDSYCALAWGSKLAGLADAPTAAAVLRDAQDERSSARERALAAWARKVVSDPNATRAADVQALRDAGLGEREIFEATAFVAFRLAFSTLNDALGVQPDWQLADAAPAEVRSAVVFGRPVAERNG